jgi:hypothetical protein
MYETRKSCLKCREIYSKGKADMRLGASRGALSGVYRAPRPNFKTGVLPVHCPFFEILAVRLSDMRGMR